MTAKYYIISQEDAEKVHIYETDSPYWRDVMFLNGAVAGKQALLSKAKLIDLDKVVNQWLLDTDSYIVAQSLNPVVKFSEFIARK